MSKFIATLSLSVMLAATSAFASPTFGPARDTKLASGGDIITYRLNLNAGETTNIRVVGNGNTDLDLFVYGPSGQLIDSDLDATDNCVSSIIPFVSGEWKIVVKNRGLGYNVYNMLVW